MAGWLDKEFLTSMNVYMRECVVADSCNFIQFVFSKKTLQEKKANQNLKLKNALGFGSD